MKGIIVLWSGAIVDIPPGWALCDGTQGTPDLRIKFVFGASAGLPPGTIGGAVSHLHTGDTDNDIHNHDIDLGTHLHSLTTYGHEHDHKGGSDIENVYPDGDFDRISDTVEPGGTTDPEFLDGTTDNDTHDHELNVNAEWHLPPYYALAYIMKL